MKKYLILFLAITIGLFCYGIVGKQGFEETQLGKASTLEDIYEIPQKVTWIINEEEAEYLFGDEIIRSDIQNYKDADSVCVVSPTGKIKLQKDTFMVEATISENIRGDNLDKGSLVWLLFNDGPGYGYDSNTGEKLEGFYYYLCQYPMKLEHEYIVSMKDYGVNDFVNEPIYNCSLPAVDYIDLTDDTIIPTMDTKEEYYLSAFANSTLICKGEKCIEYYKNYKEEILKSLNYK